MLKDRLRNYTIHKKRIEALDIRIAGLYEHIAILKHESAKERIESRVFSVPSGDVVQSGSVGDPTAMVAFSSNYKEIQDTQEQINILQREKAGLQREVDEIDAALGVLNEAELFVISEYYIDGCSWQQVLAHWCNRKGVEMSERWAQMQAAKALEKMVKVLLIA